MTRQVRPTCRSNALAATVENALRACMGRPPLGDAATREGQREPHPRPQAHGTLLVSAGPWLQIRRCHPGGDLGSRVDAELVQDAADMAVDGSFGYEKTRSDLFVGQAVGDQPRDIGFSVPEQPRAGIA